MLIISLVPGSVAAEAADENSTPSDLTVEITYELTPETPGQITAVAEYQIPSNVPRVDLGNPDPDRINIQNIQNLQKTEEGYVWEGGEAPQITYTIDLSTDTLGGDESGIDVGSWAIVDTVSPSIGWRYYDESPEYNEEYSVAGEGIAGDGYVYLGHYTTESAMVNGTNATVVKTAGMSIRPDSDELFDTFRYMEETLWNSRNDDQKLIIAVSEYTDMTNAGRETGGDFYVQSNLPLNHPDTTWAHEYVHVTQQTRMSPEMSWFVEGSAEYFTATTMLNRGMATAEEFEEQITTTDERIKHANLTDRSTWNSSYVEYDKGAHVLAFLNEQIRENTNGEASMRDVYRDVQQHDGTVNYSDFKRILIDVGGPEMGPVADRYINAIGFPDHEFESEQHLYSGYDADDDGLRNGYERQHGLNPLRQDTDQDGLNDLTEIAEGTDPVTADTDGDSIMDGLEVESDTDPLNQTAPQEFLSATAERLFGWATNSTAEDETTPKSIDSRSGLRPVANT